MIDALFMLDANVCIDVLVGRSPAAARRIEDAYEGELVTSAVVYAEVMVGANRQDSVTDALAFFRAIPILPFDIVAAENYGTIPFRRGDFDRLIAAHASALDLTLVTNNERHFKDVPGLRVENWTR